MFNPYIYFSKHAHPKQKFLKTTGFFHKLLSGILLLLACSTYSHAAAPAGYSEYYIPGDENQMANIWANIGTAGGTAGAPVVVSGANAARHTTISVVAWSDNTTVYYDHWENCKGTALGSGGCTNGYNFDPNDPSTADETYTLNKGESHIFESNNIPVNPRGTGQYYDGGDRIYVAGGAVSVSRMSWIDDVGTVFSIAMEVYPVKPQMTTYILPFGEDLYASDSTVFRSFDRVYALVQATQDNTEVQFDVNGDGTYDTICTNARSQCIYRDNFGTAAYNNSDGSMRLVCLLDRSRRKQRHRN